MKSLNKFSDLLCRIEEFILSFSIIAMAAILIGNITSRILLNRSWSFTEEVGQTLVIITTFIGIGYAALKAKHINMSAIIDFLPSRFQRYVGVAIAFVTSGTLLYLSYLALEYALRVKELGRVTPALRFPTYIICMLVFLGFLIGALEYLRIFVQLIQGKTKELSEECASAQEAEKIC